MSRFPVILVCLVLLTCLIVNAVPAAAASTITVDESRSGGRSIVGVGDIIEIKLSQQTGSTGYAWSLVSNSDPDVLAYTDREIANPSVPGGVGTDTWTFSAQQLGSSTIVLEYSQAWSGNVGRTFTFTAVVFDAAQAPASSNLMIGLLSAGFCGLIALLMIRRMNPR